MCGLYVPDQYLNVTGPVTPNASPVTLYTITAKLERCTAQALGGAMNFVEEMGPKTSKHLLHVTRHGYSDGGAGAVECIHSGMAVRECQGRNRRCLLVTYAISCCWIRRSGLAS